VGAGSQAVGGVHPEVAPPNKALTDGRPRTAARGLTPNRRTGIGEVDPRLYRVILQV
jgi:hypothetical protein